MDGQFVSLPTINIDHHAYTTNSLLSVLAQVGDEAGRSEVLMRLFQMKLTPELPGRSPDVMFVLTELVACRKGH